MLAKNLADKGAVDSRRVFAFCFSCRMNSSRLTDDVLLWTLPGAFLMDSQKVLGVMQTCCCPKFKPLKLQMFLDFLALFVT